MLIGACQTPEILGDVDAAVRVACDLAGQADAAEVDLLLFPECFLQGYLVTEQHVHVQSIEVDSSEFAAVLARLAAVRQVLVLGVLERRNHRYYNTALVIAGGHVLGGYRKTFLTAGESVFTPGDGYPVFHCGGVCFGINICYDTQFPQAAAAVASAGARVLLVPAQNMMRRERALWWQHRHNETRDGHVAGIGRCHRRAGRRPSRSRPDLRHHSSRPGGCSGPDWGHRHGDRGDWPVIAPARADTRIAPDPCIDVNRNQSGSVHMAVVLGAVDLRPGRSKMPARVVDIVAPGSTDYGEHR